MRQKGFIPVLIVIIAALIGVVGYLVYQNTQLRNVSPVPAQTPSSDATVAPTQATTTPTTDPTANWKTYVSKDKRYTFKYPDGGDWKVNEPSHPFGFWTQVICNKCTGNNLYYLQVTPIVSKTLEEFSSVSAGLGLSDNKNIKLGSLDAIQSLQAGSPQAATCKTVFTVFQNQGYQISECFSENLSTITKVEDLPKPNPDIFSTFEFLK